jgi:hypothetical protein
MVLQRGEVDYWNRFPDLKTKKKSARDGCPRWLQRVRAPLARAGLDDCERCSPAVSRAIGLFGCNGPTALSPSAVNRAKVAS